MLHRLPAFADRLHRRALPARGFERGYIRTSVGRVHTLRLQGTGTLPPVLVLHGLSAAGQHYTNLMRRLARSCEAVWSIDMPGHGGSETPPGGLDSESLRIGVAEALNELLDRPTLLFGNSLGGAAAIRYAAAHPRQVLGLVVAAPGGAAMSDSDLATFVKRFDLRSHRDGLDFVDRLFQHRHPLRHALAIGVRAHFGARSVRSFIGSLRPSDLLRPEELQRLQVPLVVLWGEADRVLEPAQRHFFEEHMPRYGTVERMETYGHVPHMCHPDCLASRIVEELELRSDRTHHSRYSRSSPAITWGPARDEPSPRKELVVDTKTAS